MSLARDWISAALAADLSQNELRVFLVLFQQTLCYGKTTDDLSIKRIAQLSMIRADRVTPAVGAVIGRGLIDAMPSKRFDHRFSIPADLLADRSPVDFFVPALPKNGEGFCFSGEVSEKRVHTSYNLTTNNPTTTPDPEMAEPVEAAGGGGLPAAVDEQAGGEAGLPFPAGFGAQGRKRAVVLLDGLSPDDARDCLRLLALAMAAGKVKSPLGYLHQLAAAARTGGLDRTALGASPTPVAATAAAAGKADYDNNAAKARWLAQNARLAGIDLDEAAAMYGMTHLLPLAKEVRT